ncbi:hypothetical protein, partial [Verrucomicrobium spinosum]|uniref:hypothetical protein n=1 Tax=Verrucomicrobium spinosum TaxID=2736 RepID=UPI00155D8E71
LQFSIPADNSFAEGALTTILQKSDAIRNGSRTDQESLESIVESFRRELQRAGPGWDRRTHRSFALDRQIRFLEKLGDPIQLQGRALGQGGEHHVYHDAGAGEVNKHTHGHRYGFVVDQGADAAKGKLELRDALPSDYLVRLDLQNAIFGDEIVLVGATKTRYSPYPAIVTRQPIASGVHPSLTELRNYMKQKGFVVLPSEIQMPGTFRGDVWYHAERGGCSPGCALMRRYLETGSFARRTMRSCWMRMCRRRGP